MLRIIEIGEIVPAEKGDSKTVINHINRTFSGHLKSVKIHIYSDTQRP